MMANMASKLAWAYGGYMLLGIVLIALSLLAETRGMVATLGLLGCGMFVGGAVKLIWMDDE